MKTRLNYVSNSSSCSFVISFGKGFSFDDFVKEVCDRCLEHRAEDEHDPTDMNKAVLNYHLRASELVYLGELVVGSKQATYTKDDKYFKEMKISASSHRDSPEERFIVNEDDRVVVEYDDVVNGMAVPASYMSMVTGEYHSNNDYKASIGRQRKAAKKILDFAKSYSNEINAFSLPHDSSTYFISRNTIWNTRALIAAGYDVELEKWMDLDKLEKILDEGNQIFGLKINHSGDGVDEDALFTCGGWDGEDVFSEWMNGVELLESEVG